MSVETNGPNIQRLIDATLGDSFYTELVAFLRAFDGMTQPAVLDKDLGAPPASPNNGDRYIIGANASAAWAGRTGQVARYYTSQAGSGWEFWVPRAGWAVAVLDELDGNGQPLRYSYSGSVWGLAAGGGSGGGMTNPMSAQDDIIVGAGGGAPTRLPHPSVVGWVLTFTAQGVAWAAATGGGGGMTNPMTTAGDIIVGGSSGNPTRLAVGNASQVLTVINPATGQLGWVTPSGGGGGGDFYKDGSVAMTGAFNEAPTKTHNLDSGVGVGGGYIVDADLTSANTIQATGNSDLIGIGSMPSGVVRRVMFTGTPIIRHNATKMILLSGADIQVAAGDTATFISVGIDSGNAIGNWKMIGYQRASGASLVVPAGGGDFKKDGSVQMTGPFNQVAAAQMPVVDSELPTASAASDTLEITGSGGDISYLGSGQAGMRRVLHFTTSLVLRHQVAWIDLPTNANITTQPGDVAEFYCRGGQSWKCISYTRDDGTPLVGGSGDFKKNGTVQMTGAFNEATPGSTSVSSGAGVISDSIVATSNTITVVGEGPLTGMGNAPLGAVRRIKLGQPMNLTHSVNFNMIGGATIAGRAGDAFIMQSVGSSQWSMVDYTRGDGTALSGSPDSTKLPLAGGTLTGPINEAYGSANISGQSKLVFTGGNQAFVSGSAGQQINGVIDTSVTAAGAVRRVVFVSPDIVLVNSNNFVLPGGANITVRNGDAMIMQADAASNAWRVIAYQRADGTALVSSAGFSEAQVRATPLTGLSTADKSAVVATDSVLVAIGKLQAHEVDQYNKANILGPVSQVGGVPTGAIISNVLDTTTNIRVIKWADGTAWALGTVAAQSIAANQTGNVVVTMPTGTFSTTAVVLPMCSPGTSQDWYGVTYAFFVSASQISIFCRNGATAQTFQTSYLAIGRWY